MTLEEIGIVSLIINEYLIIIFLVHQIIKLREDCEMRQKYYEKRIYDLRNDYHESYTELQENCLKECIKLLDEKEKLEKKVKSLEWDLEAIEIGRDRWI